MILASGFLITAALYGAPGIDGRVAPALQPQVASSTIETPRALARPSLLPAMYGSFAALQALDYHSTVATLSSGRGREGNPVMRPVVGNKAAFVAVKVASAGLTMWTAERMWKRHRVGAIVFMAVANSAMAVVVAHNYSVR